MFMTHGGILRVGEREIQAQTRESSTLSMLVYKASPILPTISPFCGFQHLYTFYHEDHSK
jgi:hypothetical protein